VKRLAIALAAALFATAAAAQALAPAEEQFRTELLARLKARDCEGAVRTVNEGLKLAKPSVWLMVGAMYEQGTCLKPNWDRALQFYQRAEAAGHRGARARIVAGQAGRDPAAALWWALGDSPQGLPAPCMAVAPLAKEPERFVEALRQWPKATLDGCVYVVAVLAAIDVESDEVTSMRVEDWSGTLRMDFTPAGGSIRWVWADLQRASTQSAISREEGLRRAQTRGAAEMAFAAMEEISQQALQKTARPAGIDPAWTVTRSYVFKPNP
jgi:hypothetical protein